MLIWSRKIICGIQEHRFPLWPFHPPKPVDVSTISIATISIGQGTAGLPECWPQTGPTLLSLGGPSDWTIQGAVWPTCDHSECCHLVGKRLQLITWKTWELPFWTFWTGKSTTVQIICFQYPCLSTTWDRVHIVWPIIWWTADNLKQHLQTICNMM